MEAAVTRICPSVCLSLFNGFPTGAYRCADNKLLHFPPTHSGRAITCELLALAT